MNNAKIIAAFAFLALLLLGFFLWNKNQLTPETHRAIKILIKQASENQLSLEEIEVLQTYPAKSIPKQSISKYYEAKILDSKEKVLYITQVPKEYLLSRFTYPEYQPVPLITKMNTDISLFLPIYPTAEKLVIENEQGNTLISVSLQNLTE